MLTLKVRDKQSTTLAFVTVSFWIVVLKFVFAGLVAAHPSVGTLTVGAMTVMEFAGAEALILAIWLGREWTEKVTATP